MVYFIFKDFIKCCSCNENGGSKSLGENQERYSNNFYCTVIPKSPLADYVAIYKLEGDRQIKFLDCYERLKPYSQ